MTATTPRSYHAAEILNLKCREAEADLMTLLLWSTGDLNVNCVNVKVFNNYIALLHSHSVYSLPLNCSILMWELVIIVIALRCSECISNDQEMKLFKIFWRV